MARKSTPAAPVKPAATADDLRTTIATLPTYQRDYYERTAVDAQKNIDQWIGHVQTDPDYAVRWLHQLQQANAKLTVARYLLGEFDNVAGDIEALVAEATSELIQHADWMGGQDIDPTKARYVSALACEVRDLQQLVGHLQILRSQLAIAEAAA